MQLLPAIDIRDGRCVRLLKGDFDKETRYDVDPADLAQRYADLGAEWLHVVDLDGAKRGEPVNLPLVRSMRERARVNVQLGGGVRNRGSLEQALDVAERIVVGSLAVSEPAMLESWAREFGPERFTLALDVRVSGDGTPVVTTHGWQDVSNTTLWTALERFESGGIENVLCTDVSRDGALAGPNLALYVECRQRFPGIELQASGGVRDLADLEALAELGVAYAISGKALLDGRLSDMEIRRFLPSE